MRVAVGGIEHETNTYADATTGLTSVEAFRVERGEEIREFFAGTETVPGGMLAAADELGIEVVPTLTAWAQPSGTIAQAAYASLRDELCGRISEALPVDALAIVLHGAGVVDGEWDLEAALCRTLRELVGADVPIVGVFDLHGNISQDMADLLDLGFGYHLYPHTDMGDRGREAVSWIPRLLAGEVRPVTHVERLPLILPPATTNADPAASINGLCRAVEERAGVIDCTFFHGFPYADTPLVGTSIWTTSDDDPGLAASCGQEVGRAVWEAREAFLPTVLDPAQAIEQALAVGDGPVVINETSDNAGGGAASDGTHLLRAMLDAGLKDACFGFICDPEVARAAHAAGPGATIDVELGGKTDDLHGSPIKASAYVKTVTDGRFMLRAWAPGLRMDHGPMARLRIDGIDVIVGSKRSQTFDPELFLLHGIDVMRYRIVALKSSQHFRAGFEPIAKAIVTADSPGLTTLRPDAFHRVHTPRPIWPLDADASYP